MGTGKRGTKRRLSAGTKAMLVMLALVLVGSALVLGRLSSGASVDLSRLKMNVLDIRDEQGGKNAADPKTEDPKTEAKVTAAPSAKKETTVKTGGSFMMTIGGSISLSGEVRKNSQSTDAKVADYADVMMLLSSRIIGDIKIAFLENILSDRYKTGDAVAPASAVVVLKEAGFNMAACGFAQAYANGKTGVEDTLETLRASGIDAAGICEDDGGKPALQSIKGVKTAVLQYTDTMSAKTRKSMVSDGTSEMVPEAEIGKITQDIAGAREAGAEAVIILLNWGRTGKEPDRNQRELAENIAKAGADLIVGNGSHIPQAAEYLTGKNGKSVLCVWSLGTLLSGDRSNIKRLSGYLLHVTVKSDGQGGAAILDPAYTPVYTWKYKQDGRYYYRCIAADGDAPDGMDNEQRKTMEKAAETVDSVLSDSSLADTGQNNAD